jgi:hypothetical protein
VACSTAQLARARVTGGAMRARRVGLWKERRRGDLLIKSRLLNTLHTLKTFNEHAPFFTF